MKEGDIMAHFSNFNSSKSNTSKPSSAASKKHRWEKDAHPAAKKTAFDCTGSKKAKNASFVHASSNRHAHNENSANAHGFGAQTYNTNTANAWRSADEKPFTRTYTINDQAKHSFSPARAFAKVFGGACMTLAGLPMLILPGPGLLFIGAGLALIASGVSDLKRAFA